MTSLPTGCLQSLRTTPVIQMEQRHLVSPAFLRGLEIRRAGRNGYQTQMGEDMVGSMIVGEYGFRLGLEGKPMVDHIGMFNSPGGLSKYSSRTKD